MTVGLTVLDRLRAVLPGEALRYELHEPNFSGNEAKYVQDCLDTGWVSSAGRYVNEFEQQLASYTGASYAIATMNGTAALHACFMMAGVDADDEVLVPSLTFVATVNALRYCNAIPHFVDSDQKTLGVSASKLQTHLESIAACENGVCVNRETGRKIKALCVTHILGHPADMNELAKVCERFNLILIEDAAEGLGSFYKDRHVGNFSMLAALSFNGNKIITTGGGGAVLTNDEKLAEKARHLTTTAKLQHQWKFEHDQVGYNYRMPNINAALGCGQLEKLPKYLVSKRRLAEKYQSIFSDSQDVHIFKEASFAKSNYWLNAMFVEDLACRDNLLTELNQQNIICRPFWELMHRLPMFDRFPKMDLSDAVNLWETAILLPSSPGLLGL